jgi:hypothetical protein
MIIRKLTNRGYFDHFHRYDAIIQKDGSTFDIHLFRHANSKIWNAHIISGNIPQGIDRDDFSYAIAASFDRKLR